MCTFDRDTKRKLTDCGHCGCGQSDKWGQHKKIGPDRRCRKCSTLVP